MVAAVVVVVSSGTGMVVPGSTIVPGVVPDGDVPGGELVEDRLLAAELVLALALDVLLLELLDRAHVAARSAVRRLRLGDEAPLRQRQRLELGEHAGGGGTSGGQGVDAPHVPRLVRMILQLVEQLVPLGGELRRPGAGAHHLVRRALLLQTPDPQQTGQTEHRHQSMPIPCTSCARRCSAAPSRGR